MEKFANEFGTKANYLQSNTDADYIPNLSTAAESSTNLIIAAGFLFEKSVETVSQNFSRSKFRNYWYSCGK